jgi:hypothetical protein
MFYILRYLNAFVTWYMCYSDKCHFEQVSFGQMTVWTTITLPIMAALTKKITLKWMKFLLKSCQTLLKKWPKFGEIFSGTVIVNKRQKLS